MTSKRLHLVLLGVICLLCVGLIGGVYGVNHLLSAEADKLLALKAKSTAQQEQRLSLAKAKQDIVTYADLQKITQAIVPEDKSQALAVREIVKIAAANGIILSSITFPASTLGTTATGAPVKSGGSASTAPTTKTGSAISSKTGSLSQLEAVKNIPGVYLLPITVQSDTHKPVAYNKLINFLNDLEHNRRTAQVSTISITPSSDNRTLLSFSLILNEYIKP